MIGRPVAVIDCFGILDDEKIKRYFELGCEVKGLGRGHVKRIKDAVKLEKGWRKDKEIVMQIEVQYEDRYLKLPDMIKFKSGLRKIVINVPDDALEEQSPPIDPVLDSLYKMLGTDYRYRPSGKSDKELLGDALQEKYSK